LPFEVRRHHQRAARAADVRHVARPGASGLVGT
jgi:hypothetical protein